MAFCIENTAVSPWRYWAQTSPFSTALETPEKTLNWQQLGFTVSRYAQYLQERGVVRGDVLTLIGKNQADTVLLYLAAQQVGAIVALTMQQPLANLKDKLHTLYKSNQPRYTWFASDKSEHSAKPEMIGPNCHILTPADALTRLSHVKAVDDYRHDDAASIIFTSGTTGSPKAVVHTHRQHLASAQGLLSEFEFTETDTWLLSLPLCHVSGLAIVYRWLFAGARLKIGTGNLAQDISEVSHASLVATQLKRLLDDDACLSLSRVLLGGSHVDHALAVRASERGIETWLGYGMTEAASTVTAKQIDNVSNAGHLLKNRDIKLDGQRIFISGKTLAAGYYSQGEITPLVDETGWFDSKDLGKWQGDELQIIGRADNQFISGGENVHCEEIEAVINQISGVVQSIIVPVEDAEFGYRPVAVVHSDKVLSKADYDDYLQSKLEKFKWPVAYFTMPKRLLEKEIKVSRKAVKDWLCSELSRSS